MTESVLIALIPAAAAIIGEIIISKRSAKDRDAKDAARQQKTEDRMAAIEKKLDEHNGYAQKFADTAVAMAKMQKDIEYLRRGQ